MTCSQKKKKVSCVHVNRVHKIIIRSTSRTYSPKLVAAVMLWTETLKLGFIWSWE